MNKPTILPETLYLNSELVIEVLKTVEKLGLTCDDASRLLHFCADKCSGYVKFKIDFYIAQENQ